MEVGDSCNLVKDFKEGEGGSWSYLGEEHPSSSQRKQLMPRKRKEAMENAYILFFCDNPKQLS